MSGTQPVLKAQSQEHPKGSARIAKAAIQTPNGSVFSVPLPGRHHHVLKKMLAAGVSRGAHLKHGFLTSEGTFVNRKVAVQIAEKAGQVPPGKYKRLLSEDIW